MSEKRTDEPLRALPAELESEHLADPPSGALPDEVSSDYEAVPSSGALPTEVSSEFHSVPPPGALPTEVSAEDDDSPAAGTLPEEVSAEFHSVPPSGALRKSVYQTNPNLSPLPSEFTGEKQTKPPLAPSSAEVVLEHQTNPPLAPLPTDFAPEPPVDPALLTLPADLCSELTRKTYRDKLTGVYNRRFLYQYLGHVISPTQTEIAQLSLAMFDIDGFRSINDTHGHNAGDTILQTLAEKLRFLVGRERILLRYAGDEFFVLFPETSRSAARAAVDQIRGLIETLRFPVATEEPPVSLTVSVGLVEFPTDVSSADELIDTVLNLVEGGKAKGGNCLVEPGEAETAGSVRKLLSRFPSPQLVGRSTALAKCISFGGLGAQDRNSLLIVEGEGGVGKTRLLLELTERRKRAGEQVVFGTCRDELQPSPYRPLLEPLRELFDDDSELSTEIALELEERELGALAEHLTSLAEPDAPAPKTGDETEKRAWLFSGLTSVLQHLARKHALVLFLDDLQSADQATLDLVVFLLRRKNPAAGVGIPIIAAVRMDPEDSPIQPGFAEFTDQITNRGNAYRVRLDPLEPRHVSAMIDACFPNNRFSDDFYAKIFDITRGSPLFIEEVLVILALSGIITEVSGEWTVRREGSLPLPSRIEEALYKHLGALDDQTADAVLKASVVGSRFNTALLAHVLKVNEGEVMQLADKAMEHRLVARPKSGKRDELQFVHRRLRALTYEEVNETDRNKVHETVASKWKEMESGDVDRALAEIAWHYEKRGDEKRSMRARGRLNERAQMLFQSEERDTYHSTADGLTAPGAEVLVPEVTAALPDAQMDSLTEFLHQLLLTFRCAQIYPDHSARRTDASKTLRYTLGRLLSHNAGLTLKAREDLLEVNGTATDPERWKPHGADLLRAFNQAHIHSLTILRDVAISELDALATGVVRFGQINAEEDWRGFLTAERCTQMGIVPREYKAVAKPDADGGDDLELPSVRKDAKAETAVIRDIVRYMAAVGQAVLLYPAHSRAVKIAIGGLLEAIGKVHVAAPLVTVSTSGSDLLVNDHRVDPRTLGESVAVVLNQLISSPGLRSLSFRRGVAPEDLERLFRFILKQWQHRQEAPTREELQTLNVGTIAINQVTFEQADALGRLIPKELDELTGRENREALMERILKSSPLELLEPSIRSVLPSVFRDLLSGREMATANELLASVLALWDLEDPGRRSAGIELFSEILEGGAHRTSHLMLKPAVPKLTYALRIEHSGPVLQQLIALSETAVETLLDSDDIRDASRIMWELGRSVAVEEDVEPEDRKRAKQAVINVMRLGGFKDAIGIRWGQSEEENALALHLLESCGENAAPWLFDLLMRSDELKTARTVATQLKSIAQPEWLSRHVLDRLVPAEGPDAGAQILSVVHILLQEPTQAVLRGLFHPHRNVSKQAREAFGKLREPEQLELISTLNRLEDPAATRLAVLLIRDVGLVQCLDLLESLLNDPHTDSRLLSEICVTLGRLESETALELLISILETPFWLRLFRRARTSDVRVAAVWALAAFIEDPRSRSALEKAAASRQKKIALAARRALLGSRTS